MNNPYVGPRSFTANEGDRFFGREREARDLYSLVVSERLVLFYAQSGAGKTSLLQTALVPQLAQNDFSVLPLCRVSGGLPAGVEHVDNIYIFNLMLSLDRSIEDPNVLAHLSLLDFLKGLVSEDGETFSYDPDIADEPLDDDDDEDAGAYILILDQFEELLTTHHDRWQDRADFFRQLNHAMLNDRNLSVVLSLREDFVASLDPYIPLMSNRLRDRYYMQRMESEAALVAIRKPAELAGCPFAAGVAEQLVDNLREIKSKQGDAAVSKSQQKGQYIEPVQLQVVCYQLWQKVQHDNKKEITADDLRQEGDIDTALSDFYQQTIHQSLQHFSMPESECRYWFEHQLITEAGTRGTVFKGDKQSGGMDNAIVEVLADHYIIRAESRSGAIWYELVHDRFIDPILTANKVWLDQRPLLRDAQNWLDTGKSNDSLLYRGKRLVESLAQNRQDQEPTVALFLEASQKLEDQITKEKLAREREQKANRRFRTWFKVATGVAVLAVGTSGWAVYEESQANLAIKAAVEAKNHAETASREATHNIGLALNEKAKQALKEENLLLHKLYSFFALKNIDPEMDQQVYHAIIDRVQLNPVAAEAYALLPLRQHDEPIDSLDFSPDGKRIVSASHDKTIRIWDVASGEQLHTLNGHDSMITHVVFSPDGRQIASSSWDKTVRVWDADSGQLLHTLEGHNFTVSTVVYSPDGKTIASASWDNTIRLWDSSTGKPLQVLEGHSGRITDIRFSPDGSRLVSSGEDAVIQVWNSRSGESITQLEGHFDAVNHLAFSPDGRFLASSSNDQTVVLWDMLRNESSRTFEGLGAAATLLAYSPDGKTLAAATADFRVHLWNTTTGEERVLAATHQGEITDLTFSASGTWLATASKDATACLWRVNDGALVQQLNGHSDEVNVVRFSPDDAMLATASNDKTLRLWNTQSGKQLHPYHRHSDQITQVVFSPDGQRFATASNDNSVRLWDAETGRNIQTFLGHRDAVTAVAFSPDQQHLLSGSADTTVRLWTIADGGELTLKGHSDTIRAVAFSHDGTRMASASADGTIRLWQAGDGQLLHVLDAHGKAVTHCEFSPDDRTLLSVADDPGIRLWDVATGRMLHDWGDRKNAIRDARFAPDGRTVAALYDDGVALVWLVESAVASQAIPLDGGMHSGLAFSRSGDLLTPPAGALEGITRGAFSPDGSLFASVNSHHTISIWHCGTGKLLRKLQGHSDEVTQLVFSPDSRLLISTANDQSLRVWNSVIGHELQVLDVGDADGIGIAFSGDGEHLVTQDAHGTMTLRRTSGEVLRQHHSDAFAAAVWSANEQKFAAELLEEALPNWKAESRDELEHLLSGVMTNKIAFSPDNSWIAVSAGGNDIHLWETATGRNHMVLKGHQDLIEAMVFSAKNKWFASASLDHSIHVWNLRTGEESQHIELGNLHLTDLTFSGDSRNLAAAFREGFVRVWERKKGTELYRLEGHQGSVNSVRFSPDGLLLATASDDRTVRLWDRKQGTQLQLFSGHGDAVHALAFSPDGRELASMAADGTIRIWPTAIEYSYEVHALKENFDAITGIYPYKLNILSLEYQPPNRRLYPVYSEATRINNPELNYWLAASDQGHPQAMLNVARMYDRLHDSDKALLWYKKAQQAGNNEAAAYLSQQHR